MAPYGRVPHPPNHRLPPRYKSEPGDKEIVPITPHNPHSQSTPKLPTTCQCCPSTRCAQCHPCHNPNPVSFHQRVTPDRSSPPTPHHFMYWCLMACPGLMSGHSREIIEVPFKSFPHWTPSTELQEDICNVRILKRSVIAIHNDMKTEYTQLRQIYPIKIRTKNDICSLIFATPVLACLSAIKGTPEVPQLHEEAVEKSSTKQSYIVTFWYKTAQLIQT